MSKVRIGFEFEVSAKLQNNTSGSTYIGIGFNGVHAFAILAAYATSGTYAPGLTAIGQN